MPPKTSKSVSQSKGKTKVTVVNVLLITLPYIRQFYVPQKPSRSQDDESGEDFGLSVPTAQLSDKTTAAATSQAQSRTKAHDLHHFVHKIMDANGQVVKQVCSICQHSYRPSTGGANIRKHLQTKHTAEYQKKCLEMGWDFARKTTEPTGQLRKNSLPAFSADAFLEYLVRFVTADDQVRIL